MPGRSALRRGCRCRGGRTAARPHCRTQSITRWACWPKRTGARRSAAHPKIGATHGASAWARDEQKGAAGASQATRDALAAGNADYEKKFGWIFLICATGKSADEMLAALNARMQNDPASEFKVAVEEQKKITRLRLEKLLRT